MWCWFRTSGFGLAVLICPLLLGWLVLGHLLLGHLLLYISCWACPAGIESGASRRRARGGCAATALTPF
jgi:hypothetical protein